MTSRDVKRPVALHCGKIASFQEFRMAEHLPARWKIPDAIDSRAGIDVTRRFGHGDALSSCPLPEVYRAVAVELDRVGTREAVLHEPRPRFTCPADCGRRVRAGS